MLQTIEKKWLLSHVLQSYLQQSFLIMSKMVSTGDKPDEQLEQCLDCIGENIRELRISKNLSQKEAAKLADLHPTYLNHVEYGRRNFSIKVLCQICNALDVLPEQVLKGALSA